MGIRDHTMQMKILLVEDNPGDVRLIQEIFKDCTVPVELEVAYDGQEALDILRPDNPDERVVLPDLMLLDLNLPRKDGRELLAEIKSDQALKRIPVVVLTSSAAERDIFQAYDLHANCYVTKAIRFDEFARSVKAILDFWLKVAILPSRSQNG